MFRLHESILKRAGCFFAALSAALTIGLGSATNAGAQPAPPNDNVTNAQGINGSSGTVYGTNLYIVPPQTAAPTNDPYPAQYSIWYLWTAPITATMAFDTRDSVNINGSPLDTVLAVYSLAPGATLSFANLKLVATNDDDMNTNYGVWSRVNFAAAAGTEYLIQVDGSQKSTPGTNAQGYITLNWAPSLVAGGFGFSATFFPASSFEDYLPNNDGSISPSIYGNQPGAPSTRITVTRNGAFTGKCEVTLMLTNAVYTNSYQTNLQQTTINVDTYSDSTRTTLVSYTNFTTSQTYFINYFTNVQFDGTYVGLPVSGESAFSESNIWAPPAIPTNGFSFTNVITNLTAGINPGLPTCAQNISFTNAVTNADNTVTVTTEMISCTNIYTNVSVPAAIEGLHYTAFSNVLTFDDFQMSQDVYVQVDPALAFYPPIISILDCALPGPEDLFNSGCNTNIENFFTNVNFDYFYEGLNASVLLTLTNAILDTNENLDIVPPTINQQFANLDILNYYGDPDQDATNGGFSDGAYVINFERETFRASRGNGNVTLYVQTYPRCRGTAYACHYTMDTTYSQEGLSFLNWNTWVPVADADYASPNNGANVYDFTASTGQLTFSICPDQSPQTITIPINDNGAEEFDEDIYIELYQTLADAEADAPSLPLNPGAVLGNIYNAHLTINYGGTSEPGGAVDTSWNVDDNSGSHPVGNPNPGANGGTGAAVEAVAIDTNGLAIIGGYFNTYDDTNVYGIARLLPNGFLDTSFNENGSGVNNGYVSAVAIDGFGRIIIGGDFSSYNNLPNIIVSNIARLNINGSLDTSFISGVGFNGPVTALAIDANGNLLVGGDFTTYNTTNCNHIARLLPSGGLDPTFLPNTGNGTTNLGTDLDVLALATDYNGNIILGGDFNYVNGSNMNYLARLLPNGALDTTFSPPQGGPDYDVYSVAVETNNEIVIGGAFQNYDTVSRNSIALVNTNGALDTTFTPGTGADGPIYAVVLQTNGNIVVGGQFTSFDTTRRIGLARLLPSGWLDTSFMDTSYDQFAGLVNPLYSTTPNTALALGLQPDGNIIVGGMFGEVGGGGSRSDSHPRANVARIIGAPTPGPNTGGIGNCPGNITFTQNPYEGLDTQSGVYVTIQRTNGSLGPVRVTLGTNTLAPGPGAATSADFGLANATATYDDLWDIYANPGYGTYGWRKSDGFYGFNNTVQPADDRGASALDLTIHNDLTANENLFANLSLLNVTSYGTSIGNQWGSLLNLGGVPIPTGPALGVPGSQLEILNNNFPVGFVGYSATNYTTVNTTNKITVTVVRTNGSSGQISVYYWTSDGVGSVNGAVPARIAAGDYTSTFGKLTFNPGVTVGAFTVKIGNFSTAQATKFFNLNFSNAAPGSILNTNDLPTNATVTIIDGSFTPGHLSFTSPTYSVSKGGVATVGVMRSGGAQGQLQVQCGTSNGSAINGLNYTGVTNTLTWGNGDVSVKPVSFQTLQDNTVDGNLTAYVFLFDATNIGNVSSNNLILTSPSNAVVTILESDSYGSLNFVAQNFNIMQTAGEALITVARTGGATGPVSVNYMTVADTNVQLPYLPAVAGSNYSATSGLLTFNQNQTAASFFVPIIATPDEGTNTANRVLTLELFNGSANISNQFPLFATLTILDPALILNQPGSVDLPAQAQMGNGFNNLVQSVALQPDGSVLAGGDFTYFDNFPFGYVARLMPNASFDGTFLFDQAGASGPVNQVLSVITTTNSNQTNNGPIMIVGGFNQVNGTYRNGIARLNLNGGVDESFNPGSGADNAIYAIAEAFPYPALTNSPLAYYVAGSFANFDDVSSGGIVRVNGATNSPGLQGTPDPNFNVGQGVTGNNAVVRALAVQQNGQVIAGGDFTSFNGAPYNYLVRLNPDGSVDPTFNTNSGPSDSVRAIVIQPDGRILIGGLFTNVNGSNYNYLARLNTDGSTDTNFNTGGTNGGDNTVLALAIDDQERILVGGEFTRFSSVTRSGITRLNPDGTVDPTINFQSGADGGFVDSIVIQTNEEIDVGGGFSTFEGIAANNFVRLYGGAFAGDGTAQFSQYIYGVLENGTNAIITIQRLGGEGTTNLPTASITFSTTTNGAVLTNTVPAVPGTDYTSVTTNLTFPLGETFKTVTIPILSNNVVGSNKSVNLILYNPTNAGIGQQASAYLVITNVNSEVEFSAPTYNQSANETTAIIPVVRIGNPYDTVSVTVYTGTNGTATPYTNYMPTSTNLIFNSGVTTQYFLVPLLNATNMFSADTVDLELSSPSNAIIGSPSSATLYIGNVYNGYGVLAFSQPSYSVNGGASNALITIVRTNGSSNTVSVTLTTSNGTAIAGINYQAVQVTNTFGPGELSKTVSIPLLPETNASADLTLYLTLSNPTGGATIGGAAQEVLTIQNNIEDFSFSNSFFFVNEYATNAILQVVRGGPATNPASVTYFTPPPPPNDSESNGFALPGIDYGFVSNTLTFQSNEVQTISIPIYQGTNVYQSLSFNVVLTNPAPIPTNLNVNIQIASPGTNTVTINGDVTGFEFATNAYAIGENGSNIVITVIRVNAQTGNASVQFGTSDGTATNQVDYIGTNGTLVFSNGITSNSFTVSILNPNIVENNKTFNVSLSNAMVLSLPNPSTNAYVLSPSNTTVTITNVLSGVSFESSAYTVAKCAGTPASIEVVLSGLTNGIVSVLCGTTNGGSATPFVNYTPVTTNLTFSNGVTTQTMYVPIINNNIIGPDQTVLLTLSSVEGAQLINPSTAVLTIQECNPDIVQSGTAFVSGNLLPPGAILPNETVTILLGLRDIAGSNTTDLVATLLSTNGVVATSADTNVIYGELITHGPTVSRPFTFTAAGTNGQTIVANLALQDGSATYSNVSFSFTLGGGTATFSTNETLYLFGSNSLPSKAYNSNPPNYGYPSVINVSGIVGTVTAVTATLGDFGHTFPANVTAVLEGPQGQATYLMSDCGNGHPVQNISLTFSQSASQSLPETSAITSGTYLPTAYDSALLTNTLPSQPQIPLPPYPTSLTNFVGQSPNGTWLLWVVQEVEFDSGYISNGWSLNISTGISVAEDSDLELLLTNTPSVATVSNALTYIISVTNYGPAAATNVIITDTLPSGLVSNISSGSTAGTITVGTNGGLIIWTNAVPMLAVGSGVTFTNTVMPGTNALDDYITNIAAAIANQPDPNSNNVQTNVLLVSPVNADLAVSLSGNPNPVLDGANITYIIVVTNNGPSVATNVIATNTLPAGFIVLTNQTVFTQGTTNGGTGPMTVWNVGTLGSTSGSSATLTLVAVANPFVDPSTNFDTVTVFSPVTDLSKLNNFASVKTVVEPAIISVGAVGGGPNYSLKWPAVAGNFVLQGAVNLSGPWVSLANPAPVNGQYTYGLSGTNHYHFFRLMSQLP